MSSSLSKTKIINPKENLFNYKYMIDKAFYKKKLRKILFKNENYKNYIKQVQVVKQVTNALIRKRKRAILKRSARVTIA
jgi:hypothetical protein